MGNAFLHEFLAVLTRRELAINCTLIPYIAKGGRNSHLVYDVGSHSKTGVFSLCFVDVAFWPAYAV